MNHIARPSNKQTDKKKTCNQRSKNKLKKKTPEIFKIFTSVYQVEAHLGTKSNSISYFTLKNQSSKFIFIWPNIDALKLLNWLFEGEI